MFCYSGFISKANTVHMDIILRSVKTYYHFLKEQICKLFFLMFSLLNILSVFSPVVVAPFD